MALLEHSRGPGGPFFILCSEARLALLLRISARKISPVTWGSHCTLALLEHARVSGGQKV